MRLLVVDGSEPESSFSCAPYCRIAPQPPGPGLPEQAIAQVTAWSFQEVRI